MQKRPHVGSLPDVIAMSLAYYSRDIGVKSLALFLLSSNLLVRLKPWALALKLKENKRLTSLQAVSEFVVDSKHPSVLSKP
jgi:hypothetical protein